MWLADGRAYVAFTAGVADKLAELQRDFPYRDRLTGITRALSMSRLQRIGDQLGADRDALRDGRDPGTDPSITATHGDFGYGIDVAGNGLVVDVDDPTPQLEKAMRHRYTPNLTVHAGKGGPAACSITNCLPQSNGGIRFDRDIGYCTTGFNTYGGSGNRYMLSAGHCTLESGGSANRSHAGRYYGNTNSPGRALYSGRDDFERVYLTNIGSWDTTNLIRLDGTTTRPITSWIYNSQFVVGTQIGRSGATTETDRGYITYIGYNPSWVLSHTASFIQTDACAQGGDSGGPVWRNNTAYGIVSGGTVSLACSDPNAWMAFGTIEYALGDLSLYLQTTDYNDPPTAKFTTSCSVLYQCSFNGSASNDIEGSGLTYAWNFGDGTTGTGSAASHTYANGTTRTVTLTVTDSGGAKGSVAHTVTPKLA